MIVLTEKKSILITGASSGIGEAIGQHFSAAGYRVIVISRTKPKGFPYDRWLPWDLTKPHLLTSELLRDSLGEDVELFVGNAGILKGYSPDEYHLDEIREMLDLHITSQVLLMNYLVTQMSVKKYGRVVLIGSTAADTGHPDIMYSATKAAIAALTKSYAHLYESNDITFNCIQPGAIKTPITKGLSLANREFLSKRTVISGPYLEIDRVVAMARTLLSPDCRITGACITVGQNAVWRT